MSGNLKLFIKKTFQFEKNCQFFLLVKVFPLSFAVNIMVIEEELKWENDTWFLTRLKYLLYHHFTSEKIKFKNRFL